MPSPPNRPQLRTRSRDGRPPDPPPMETQSCPRRRCPRSTDDPDTRLRRACGLCWRLVKTPRLVLAARRCERGQACSLDGARITRPNVGPLSPNNSQVWSTSAGNNLARSSSAVGQTWTIWAQLWPNWTNIGQCRQGLAGFGMRKTSAEFGQICISPSSPGVTSRKCGEAATSPAIEDTLRLVKSIAPSLHKSHPKSAQASLLSKELPRVRTRPGRERHHTIDTKSKAPRPTVHKHNR